jgi:hypothetical protein
MLCRQPTWRGEKKKGHIEMYIKIKGGGSRQLCARDMMIVVERSAPADQLTGR